jgi:hypothetical protein
MTRLSRHGLLRLAECMSDRDQQIVLTVYQLRLVSARQLERLYFPGAESHPSLARSARRVLARLSSERLLGRLERRIGGVRAGSAGHIYSLGPAGKRLVAYWAGDGMGPVRSFYEPGTAFVRHTLAVSEIYVQLCEAERLSRCEVLAFQSEPACWRQYVAIGGLAAILKPDAFVRLGAGDFEERAFLEVDCGTEGRGALVRKCTRYFDYFRSGREQAQSGAFPRVVWITTARTRVQLLVDVCSSLPPAAWQVFAVGTHDRAVELLSGGASPVVAQRSAS